VTSVSNSQPLTQSLFIFSLCEHLVSFFVALSWSLTLASLLFGYSHMHSYTSAMLLYFSSCLPIISLDYATNTLTLSPPDATHWLLSEYATQSKYIHTCTHTNAHIDVVGIALMCCLSTDKQQPCSHQCQRWASFLHRASQLVNVAHLIGTELVTYFQTWLCQLSRASRPRFLTTMQQCWRPEAYCVPRHHNHRQQPPHST